MRPVHCLIKLLSFHYRNAIPSFLIFTTHDAFNIAEPSSMQDMYHTRAAFLSVVKPNQSNYSELEANTCSRRQERENACRQITIGFGFASDWSRN